jgi:hypothetical protein
LLLREEALATFISCHEDATEALEDGAVTETEDLFSTTFKNWMTKELPDNLTGRTLKKSLTSEKISKPNDLTLSEFLKRLKKINKYITYCPGETAPLTNEYLITVLEQALPYAWRVDLMKRADYATMSLPQVESYFKLLENIKEAPARRPSNDKRSNQGVSSNRSNNNNRSGSGNRTNSRGNGNNRGRGNNRSNNRGNRNRVANPAPVQALRRSNRRRGPYCPHHRTNDHDGSDCPDYQQYLHTRNNDNEASQCNSSCTCTHYTSCIEPTEYSKDRQS